MADSIFPGEQPDRLEEECGVFGVYAPGEDVARLTCYGLQALQHRGQESAGIAVGDGSTVIEAKDLGLVTQVFDEATLAGLGEGVVAIGHVRYSTSGGKASWEAAQPHISAIDDTLIALAHNGTLVNTNHLRAQLIDEGEHLRAGTDSEVAAKAIGHLTRQTHHLREGIRYAMENLEGAYAMVLASPEALYAFRDPHGIRPLCIGQLPEGRGWVVSSETCGLDIVGAEYVRDVEPGEMVRFTAEGMVSEQAVPPRPGPPVSSSTYTSPGPTRCSTGNRSTRRAAPWAAFWPTRRPWRPTSCSACPTPACRRPWAIPRPRAFRSPTVS